MQQPGTERDALVAGFLVCAQQRPESGQCEHAPGAIRVDHEALKDRRHRQRHGGPREPRGVGPPRGQPGAVPRERGTCGRDQDQEQHDRAMAAEREGGRDERRQPGSMHRVDPAVPAAPLDVRLQLTAVVGAVVAATMHVFDGQRAIEQQALRDDQVVRLVSAGDHRRRAPRRQREDRSGDHARRHARRADRRAGCRLLPLGARRASA